MPPSFDRLHDYPSAAHGSVDRSEERSFRYGIRGPGGDGLVAAPAHRGKHDKALLHSIGERCDGIEPSRCKHRGIVGR
jgi:hypothetical protein